MTFATQVMAWQRAAGLPDPWQEAAPLGWISRLRERVRESAVPAPPPIADVELAGTLWAAGRALSIDDAVAIALAIGRNTPPAAPTLTEESRSRPRLGHAFDLTRREREILGLLTRRLTDFEIAEQLFISPKTASNHVANILDKLGAANRREAAAIAVRQTLI
jgi:DNA-binding CsgD family transcriptional regulator